MAGVPQFGNWSDNGDVPYTEFFEKARKGKGGVKPSTLPVKNSSSDNMQPKVLDERRSMDTPENHVDQAKNHSLDSSMQSRDRTSSGDPQRRTTRASAGPERSMENFQVNSPHHGKAAERSGLASPFRNQGFGSSTPGRSKLRQNEEVQEKSTAVPKFGDWDEKDPSAGDNYTAVFGRVKQERHGEEKPSDANQSVPNPHGGGGNPESSGCSCFSWFKS